MKILTYITLMSLLSLKAQASYTERSLLCKFDNNPYNLDFKIQETNLPKGLVDITKRPDQNNFSLYGQVNFIGSSPINLVSSKKTGPGFFEQIDENLWYFTDQYRPASKEFCHIQNTISESGRPNWRCNKTYSSKGEPPQPYYVLNPHNAGLPSENILKQKLKQKIKSFKLKTNELNFLYKNKVYNLKISTEATKNPNYLKSFKCQNDASLVSCGENCLSYTYKASPDFYTESKAYRFNISTDTNQAVIEFTLALSNHDLDGYSFNEEFLEVSLKEALKGQKENIQNGQAFYSLISISNKIATQTNRNPTNVKVMLY